MISSKTLFLKKAGCLAMLGTVCLGCSQGDKLEKLVVDGTVTFAGEPISNGEILFYPIDGTLGPVSGGPIKDGSYKAEGRGGVPIGKQRVEIRAFRAPQRSRSGIVFQEGGPVVQYLPAKFNDHSELIVTIESNGRNTTKNFDLINKDTK